MIEYLFWFSATLVVYGTVGYPALIWVLAKLAPKPVHKGDILPTVTCVIAARNEEHTIAAKLDNLLASDYPPDRLDIIVVSDGSTDNTAAIIEQYCSTSSHASRSLDPSRLTFLQVLTPPLAKGDQGGFDNECYNPSHRVTLLRVPSSKGKAHALNMGIAAATGEIILFADARQRFAPDAVRLLVRNFADPEVGAVSGELVLAEETSTQGENAGGGIFWRFEKWVRNSESRSGSTIGCTGAIYAARRILIDPLPEGILLDDVLAPVRILLKGYRVVFEEHARAFDRLPELLSREFGRKARVRAGNIQLLTLIPTLLLNPLRGSVTWRFVSHKLLPRVLMPYCLLLLLISNLFLGGLLYQSALVLQGLVYVAGICGLLLGTRAARPLRAASTFLMLNAAAVTGSVHYIFGSDRDLWSGRPLKEIPRSKAAE